MANSLKTKEAVRHFIEMVYVAPQNAVDEKGMPVLVYKRGLELDDKSHKLVVENMRKGETDICIPTQIKLMSGTIINEAIYINLNNRDLIRAATTSTQQISEEDAKKAGKPVLYDQDGNVLKLN